MIALRTQETPNLTGSVAVIYKKPVSSFSDAVRVLAYCAAVALQLFKFYILFIGDSVGPPYKAFILYQLVAGLAFRPHRNSAKSTAIPF
jgi:hypothetical protein